MTNTKSGSCMHCAFTMSDVVLKRGIERVEVDWSQVTTEILQRAFRVRKLRV